MSVSEKQLIANRKNAQKSTGPKTKRGKAISSKNGLKHGRRSPDVILNSPHLKENVSEYNMLLNSLFDDLKPVGRFQELLVNKIANSLWRSQRVIIAETAQLHRQFKSVDGEVSFKTFYAKQDGDIDENNPDEVAEFKSEWKSILTGINCIPADSANINILRYEMRVDSQLTRSLKLLKYLQASSNKTNKNNKDNDDTLKILQI